MPNSVEATPPFTVWEPSSTHSCSILPSPTHSHPSSPSPPSHHMLPPLYPELGGSSLSTMRSACVARRPLATPPRLRSPPACGAVRCQPTVRCDAAARHAKLKTIVIRLRPRPRGCRCAWICWGAPCAPPSPQARPLPCLVMLADIGGDAVVVIPVIPTVIDGDAAARHAKRKTIVIRLRPRPCGRRCYRTCRGAPCAPPVPPAPPAPTVAPPPLRALLARRENR